jgi:hypothetical protein
VSSDHPRPGANDKRQRCATILEVARTYAHLIAQGKLARPAARCASLASPKSKAALFCSTRDPNSRSRSSPTSTWTWSAAAAHQSRLPCNALARQPAEFVNDVAEAFLASSMPRAMPSQPVRSARYPMIASSGDKQALLAQIKEFDAGSDHVGVHRQLVPHPDHL